MKQRGHQNHHLFAYSVGQRLFQHPTLFKYDQMRPEIGTRITIKLQNFGDSRSGQLGSFDKLQYGLRKCTWTYLLPK